MLQIVLFSSVTVGNLCVQFDSEVVSHLCCMFFACFNTMWLIIPFPKLQTKFKHTLSPRKREKEKKLSLTQNQEMQQELEAMKVIVT